MLRASLVVALFLSICAFTASTAQRGAPLSDVRLARTQRIQLGGEAIKLAARGGAVKALRVSELTSSGVEVLAGDELHADATGKINVGKYIGDVGPDGVKAFRVTSANTPSIFRKHFPRLPTLPVFKKYNIVEGYNHGALIWRVGAEDGWHLCGSHGYMIAGRSGVVTFQVNDAYQADNDKSKKFHVTLSVTPRRKSGRKHSHA